MKRLGKALLSLIVIAVFGVLIFKYSYKLAPDDFITDRTTFIYINKNINREKLRKFEETFGTEKIAEKDIVEKIKNICLLSQSKIYSSRFDVVGIVDMGAYHPLMLMKLKKYFDFREDNFYELKDEYKDELGISQREEIFLKPHRGLFHPLMLMKLKKYFDFREDNFYELKDEYKDELGISQREEIFLKPHRGLFFIGGDTEKIDEIIFNKNKRRDEIIFNKNKRSLKAVKILNEKAESGLGALMLNQERERLFGIDRIIISGDTKGNKVFLDGCIYGDNEIIKDLNVQPEKRRMNKYITSNRLYISTANLKKMDTFILRALSYKAKSSHKTNLVQELFAKGFADMISNRLYISTANLKKMDTFILRALSYKAKSSHKTNLVQELFAKGFADMISELNGEMVIDLENGNYLLGLKSSQNAEMFVEYLKNDENINIEKDIEGNIYICIGRDTFVPVENPKIVEDNQFLTGEIDTYYGKVQADGFYAPDRLRIKAEIELEK